MLGLDEIKQRLRQVRKQFEDCLAAFDVDGLTARLIHLSEQQQDPNLYSDLARAQKINTEAKQVSDRLSDLAKKQAELTSLTELADLLSEDEGDMLPELAASLAALEEGVERLNLTTLLKGEYDGMSAIVTIHAGAGGTEAMDWVSMLLRMYRMYCDKNGFSIEVLDSLDGEEAGLKSITFLVKGTSAYGFLKAEKGVHRLVRISPFDTNARRHTSFASVEVLPEIEGDTAIKIASDEIRIDTYRSSGPGGQHVNKTDSAVRITHIPTGLVAACQTGRSQLQNRENAMNMLRAKLAEKKERELAEKLSGLKGELKRIEWGSQIRSYVFQPYTLVKDHRTGFEQPDVSAVMDGEITGFIFDFLRKS